MLMKYHVEMKDSSWTAWGDLVTDQLLALGGYKHLNHDFPIFKMDVTIMPKSIGCYKI